MQSRASSPLRLVIFDLDGVVYRGGSVVPGAPELIAWLHAIGIAVRFATNNSMSTPAAFAARLGSLGIPAGADEVVTSTTATVEHLRRHLPEVERILAVGEAGMRDVLRGAGYDVTAAADAVGVEYRGGPLAGRYDAVVAGLDLHFGFPALAAAQTAIADGARFIATNADARYPTERGFLPGAGAVVAAIRVASGVEPTVIGKPEPAIFRSILEERGVEPGEALVVGDNPDADIRAARAAAIPSVLVLTGVADAASAAALSGERRPDAIAAGPEELRRLIEARR
jgi:4-nitrophenyl phosphatase